MPNPFQEFFYFSRGERRGMLVLLVGIVLAFLAGRVYMHLRDRHVPTEAELQRQADATAEQEAFIASVQDKEPERRQAQGYKSGHPAKPQPTVLNPSPFDPNTTDSATFCRMGLPDWMAGNIVRYRQAGGRFRQAEDFRKIYGLTEAQYQVLAPYIRIASEKTRTDATVAEAVGLYDPPADRDSTAASRLYPEKYPAGTFIDLNRADTTELKRIPGIGSGIARLIVGYRQRLGGFYTVRQLQEVRLDSRRLQPWFTIDTLAIRRIDLNRAGIERLRSHPYINFYQAKAFVEHRKKHGPLRSLKPFALYEEFTKADLERISHYVCF